MSLAGASAEAPIVDFVLHRVSTPDTFQITNQRRVGGGMGACATNSLEIGERSVCLRVGAIGVR